MKEYTRDDLINLLTRIWTKSTVDGVLEFENVAYPIELFDELGQALMDLGAIGVDQRKYGDIDFRPNE